MLRACTQDEAVRMMQGLVMKLQNELQASHGSEAQVTEM